MRIVRYNKNIVEGKKIRKTVALLVASFILVTVGTVVGCLIVKSGLPGTHGQIVLADGLSSAARDFIGDKLDEIEVAKDVTISDRRTTRVDFEDDCEGDDDGYSGKGVEDEAGEACGVDGDVRKREVLYDIYVATTDFYDTMVDVAAEEFKETIPGVTDDIFVTMASGVGGSKVKLIPISELQNKVKLLSLDGHYYLNDFNEGAFFDLVQIEGDDASDVGRVWSVLKETAPTFPSRETVLSFVQTGVTALARGMNSKLLQVGGSASYFAEAVSEYLSSFDLTHTSNEASFSANAPGNSVRSQVCALPGMIDVLTSIGLDIVELTGNHNQDCGDEDAVSTIEQYQALGIRTVGGGATAELAAVPLKIEEKGTNITMLGYNLSTGGYTLDETPGANFYAKDKAMTDIAEAKERGDFMIVDVQYYECNDYDKPYEETHCDYADSAAGDQIGLFREIIDMGADIVVGTSAHQTQTYEIYNDGVIYYGLGNIFFDQIWWPMTTRSLVLEHYFYGGKLLQTRLAGTIYDDSMQTRMMDTETLAWFIDRLNAARPSH